jgi:hypothetical protein
VQKARECGNALVNLHQSKLSAVYLSCPTGKIAGWTNRNSNRAQSSVCEHSRSPRLLIYSHGAGCGCQIAVRCRAASW